MKFFLSLLLASFSLMGCSHVDQKSPLLKEPNDPPHILSTTQFIDDLVGKIAQDRLSHEALILGELDPHSYELVKGDGEKIEKATAFFCHGLGLEHGASLTHHLLNHKKTVDLGSFLKENHSQELIFSDGIVDPHVWMDVSLWSQTIDPIVKTLIDIDPAGKDFFIENGNLLKKEMAELHQNIQTTLLKIPEEKRYLVTSHNAFHYFAKAYLGEGWQERFDAPEGIAPEGQLSLNDINRILSYLEKHHTTTLFPESNVSKDSLQKIATCASKKLFPVTIAKKPLHADALGPKGSEVSTYFCMMQYNLSVLTEAWSEQPHLPSR